jgi:hypothetical protein
VPLPPYSPELNPVERVRLYLRERFLSLRVLDDTGTIINGCCQAWTTLTQDPARIQSLCGYPGSCGSLHRLAGMSLFLMRLRMFQCHCWQFHRITLEAHQCCSTTSYQRHELLTDMGPVTKADGHDGFGLGLAMSLFQASHPASRMAW